MSRFGSTASEIQFHELSAESFQRRADELTIGTYPHLMMQRQADLHKFNAYECRLHVEIDEKRWAEVRGRECQGC